MVDSVHSSDLPTDQTPRVDSIPALIESNLSDYWVRLGEAEGGELYSGDDIRWEYSGCAYLNRVLESHLDRQTADSAIEKVKLTFRQRSAAVTWFVGPTVSPSDLGTRLVEHGFSRYDDWIGMSHDLEKFGTPPAAHDGMTITWVKSASHQNDWTRVVARSFRFPRSARRRLGQSLEVGSNQDMRHLLAFLGGRPVAACSLFVKDGVAGVYLVSTIPEMRGMGLGTYLTWFALTQAREMGCRLAVLQSTARARSIYESLGFESHCFIEVYRYDAPGPPLKRIARFAFRSTRKLLSSRSIRRVLPWRGRREDTAVHERPAPSHAH